MRTFRSSDHPSFSRPCRNPARAFRSRSAELTSTPTRRIRSPCLRARRERPSPRRTAEQRDKLAALYLIELHSVLCQQATARLQDIELGEDQSGGNGTTPVIRL